MHYYRLYFVSPVTGQFARFAELEAADDEAAAAIARDEAGNEVAELWCRNRLVLTLGGGRETGRNLLKAAE
jgi:hypothetical protein